MGTSQATVAAVASDTQHRFSKVPRDFIELLEGYGVQGDAHAGETVQHLSRVKRSPTEPNLRQVHLIPSEFFDLAREHGHDLSPGDLGENILTEGIDVLGLPRDTLLRVGPDAIVRVTGLRNPCAQIDRFRDGLLRVAVGRDDDGGVVLRTGVMGVVVASGRVTPGDEIRVELPAEPHHRLERV
jgi:MOSC domain-containing protein YiiM